MKKYTTLLFDADATLLDFEMTEHQALVSVFGKYQIPFDEAVKQQYAEINHSLWREFELGKIDKKTVLETRFGKLFSKIGVNADGAAFEHEYQSALASGAYLMQGADELCQNLMAEYDLYIVTNGVAGTQYRRLRETGLDQFMKGIFISEEIGYAKPRIEFFEHVFNRVAEKEKSRMLIIGDSLSSDIKGGNTAGLDTCWFNQKGQKAETAVDITYEIHTLEELYRVLEDA